MHEKKIWQTKNKKSILKTKIYEVFELDCFLPSKDINNTFYSITLPDWVNVFSLTEDKKMIFVKQHRIGSDIVTTEVPAGGIDKGENPVDAAERELVEETGFTSDNVVLLKKIRVNPAIQNNYCYVFIALNCKKNKSTKFDHSEEIDVVLKDLSELDNILNEDTIDNSLSYLGCCLAKKYLKENGII